MAAQRRRDLSKEKPLPQAAGVRSGPSVLEAKLGRELNAARCAASEERIADADVAGSGDRIATGPGFERIRPVEGKAVDSRIRDECRQERVRKIGMVDDVEKVGANLQIQTLSKDRVFVHGKVAIAYRWVREASRGLRLRSGAYRARSRYLPRSRYRRRWQH